MRAAAQLTLATLALYASWKLLRAAESGAGCPRLDWCLCKTARHGPRVLCRAIGDGDKLTVEFSKLAGLVMDSLILDGVNVTALPPRFFENLTVKALYVKNTPLQFTEPDSFKGARILSTLFMGRNWLGEIPDGLMAVPGLKELRLPNNYITSTDNLPPLQNVTALDLSGNLIEALNNTRLRTLTSLEKVWFGNNRIFYVGPHFFKNVTRLAFIDLHNNFLTNIYYSFQGLQYLTELDLSHNRIIGIDKLATGTTPRLKILRVGNNRLSWVPKFGVFNIAIETLDLKKCNISELRNDTFSALPELTSLDLSYNVISYIPGNSFRKEANLKYFSAAKNRLRSIENTFILTRRVEKLNLSMNFIEDIGDALIKMKDLKVLTLRGNRIRFIRDGTFRSNSLLHHLDLRGNRLEWLGQDCFKRLVSLKVLLITQNPLVSLNGSIHGLNNLRYLFIHNNQLTALRCTDFEGSPQLTSIYAYGNNLTSVRGAFRRLKNLQVLMLQKNRLRSVHRHSFPDTLDKLKKLVLNVLLIAALATATAYLKYKHEIRVWLYARGVCRSLQCIKEDDVDEDKDFDVFLSFSNKDREWVYSELLPKVEEHGFAVCTFDRNFKGGFLIQDIVQEAVYCSRRTLLVLTQNYVESEWCRWEFRVAQHHALEDNINRLIIVVVGEVRVEGVDEELQQYMETTTYLCWSETHFWDKLLYSLPKRYARTRVIPNVYTMTAVAPCTEH